MNAFEALTLPHIGVLYKLAFHLTGNRDDAEDIVQEVFIKASGAFHGLKDHSKCKSWLCSILYRTFVDDYRRRKRVFILEDSDFDIENAPDIAEGSDNQWPDRFTSEDISRALETLDPRFRLPLVAHFLSGQSYQEIAESLEIPIGTVMSRIHRAKNAMRRELTKQSHPNLKIIRGGRNGM